MFYVEKFTFFNSFFIGLIYFISQQIDNHLRQIVDFIFLPFFLTFFVVNQTSEKNYIHFLTFFFPSIFPPNFLSLAFSGSRTELKGFKLKKMVIKLKTTQSIEPDKESVDLFNSTNQGVKKSSLFQNAYSTS